MPPPTTELSPLEKLDKHLTLAAEARKNDHAHPFDMVDEESDLLAIDPFHRLRFALGKISEMVLPVFQGADAAAGEHQRTHKRNAKIAACTGAIAIIAACVQLGFTAIELTPKWVVFGEFAAVLLCLVTILIGLRTARQNKWLTCRNVAERCRHLKFTALTRKDLWCGPTEAWEKWLHDQVRKLREVSERKDLENWVTDDPLLDPPGDLSACASASTESAALACYFRHKRVIYQRGFFEERAKKHGRHQHRFHLVPSGCFWASVGAVFFHFALDLSAPHISDNELRHTIELAARWLIVVAAAAPAIGAGVRTWLLAFEFGRSALLYRAQRSCLDKRLEALSKESPDCIFAAIWFTEQALEEEHRAWIRLMLDAEWFG